MQPGDEIVTIQPLWHQGADVGDRLGRIISISGYIVVDLYDYEYNPVKCFRNEIEVIRRADADEKLEVELDSIFGDLL